MSEEVKEGSAVVHPNHYNIYDVETMDMMASIWGNKEVAIWAKLNAFKYRMRMGYKKGVDITQDFQKEQECLKIKKIYENRARLEEGITVGSLNAFNKGDILNNDSTGEEGK